jgi:tRNA nucleotidyltransferase (CCA-adding enzyme)
MQLSLDQRFGFKKIHHKLVEEVFNDVPFYIVGGAVRDQFLGIQSHDIDFTTPVLPDEIKSRLIKGGLSWTPDKTAESHGIFRVIDPWKEAGIVDAATFRIDEVTDGRHAQVSFTDSIEKDLARRDLTINAMAWRVDAGAPAKKLIDPFDGMGDLADAEIRLVGDPEARIREDYLRMMRVARFATKLNGVIVPSTLQACRKYADNICSVSKERIREEILKALEYKEAGWMFRHMRNLGLLPYVMPDLNRGIGIAQNKHHKDDVFEHLCFCVDNCKGKKYHPLLKLATLFHDIAKPHTKKIISNDATFHNHEVLGASIVYNWMKEYKFSNTEIQYVVKMVRHHQWRFEFSENHHFVCQKCGHKYKW